MRTNIEPVSLRYNAGTCPACRDYLWMDVEVGVVVSEPFLQSDGKAGVTARAVPVAAKLSHECERNLEDA